jgi:hypothetical protein
MPSATTGCEGGRIAAAPAPTQPEGSEEDESGAYVGAGVVVVAAVVVVAVVVPVVVVVPAPLARADPRPRTAARTPQTSSPRPLRIRTV